MFKCLQLFVPNMSLDVCLKKLHLVKVGAFVWYSVKIRVIFGIRFEIWKVDKRATYTKTETFKLYCRVFVFFETQCIIKSIICMQVLHLHCYSTNN